MDGSNPRNWKEIIPWLPFAVLISACIVLFLQKVVEQNFGQALLALILAFAITAVTFHSKTWLDKTNPNWAYPGGLVLLLSILSIPFFEEKRYPLSAWFPAHASEADLAAAKTQQLNDDQKRVSEAEQARDAAVSALKENQRTSTDDSARVAALQAQLADARTEAANARARLGEFQRQQQAAQNNVFSFPPAPIKKRKLIQHEATDLIAKLAGFDEAFRLLGATSEKFIPTQSHEAPPDLRQRIKIASDTSATLLQFRAAIQQAVSAIPERKEEIANMLGGADWETSSAFDELLRLVDSYAQNMSEYAGEAPLGEGIVMALSRPLEADVERPLQKFNSWRGEMPARIEELKSEARQDLQ